MISTLKFYIFGLENFRCSISKKSDRMTRKMTGDIKPQNDNYFSLL